MVGGAFRILFDLFWRSPEDVATEGLPRILFDGLQSGIPWGLEVLALPF